MSLPARVAAVLASAALLGACGVARGSGPTLHGGEIEPAVAAPTLALTDQHGRPYRLQDRIGRVALVYFGYTHCPDFCPGTLALYRRVARSLGRGAGRVDFVMVTIDPERDTAAVLDRYLGAFDRRFVGLVGDLAATTAAEKAWGVQADPVEEGGGRFFDHTVAVYLIDRAGRLRVAYPFGVRAPDVAADVRTLLAENCPPELRSRCAA